MPKKSKNKLGLKKAVRSRHMFKPVKADPERKLIPRGEVARALGCSIMTVKRMEKRHGGTLDGIKLRGPKSATYYSVAQISEVLGINVNA